MEKAGKMSTVPGLTRHMGLLAAGLILWGSVAPAWAAQPTVAQMLGYRPRQEGVNYSTPSGDAVTACKVELVKGQRKGSGWLLRDGNGQPVRWFFDTNDDNKIDVWAYFKDGVEVYREIDSTYTGKPDQYRWLNSGGMKWGIDESRDGHIKSWKAISPEEVSQEILQALVKQDYARLQALMITEAEIKELNLPADMAAKIRDSQKNAPAKFKATAAKLTSLGPKAIWLHLETKAPRCIPADQIGTRYDVVKHAAGTVLYDAEGKNDWFQTGEMIQVGMAWRIVDAPAPGAANDDGTDDKGGSNKVIQNIKDNPKLVALIQKLTELDKLQPPTGSTPDAAAVRHHLRRADMLEEIIAEVDAKERDPWIRQVADSLSTATQASPASETVALTRLQSLEGQLVSKIPGSNLAAYVAFRDLQTIYNLKINTEKDFNKVQKDHLERLSKFVQTYSKAEDTPDALQQLGMISEFLDKDVEAKNWYMQLVKNFPATVQAAKAEGCIRRMDSDGQVFKLAGPMLNDPNMVFDIDTYKGKIVVVYYYAAWNSQSVGDFAKLKQLLDLYGKKGVELVCINLDNKIEEARDFLSHSPAPGTHLYQTGGLESKLAVHYGVVVLPNLFVIDRTGKVANHKLQTNGVEDEIKKQLLK
jgi:Thioredoxin-like